MSKSSIKIDPEAITMLKEEELKEYVRVADQFNVIAEKLRNILRNNSDEPPPSLTSDEIKPLEMILSLFFQGSMLYERCLQFFNEDILTQENIKQLTIYKNDNKKFFKGKRVRNVPGAYRYAIIANYPTIMEIVSTLNASNAVILNVFVALCPDISVNFSIMPNERRTMNNAIIKSVNHLFAFYKTSTVINAIASNENLHTLYAMIINNVAKLLDKANSKSNIKSNSK